MGLLDSLFISGTNNNRYNKYKEGTLLKLDNVNAREQLDFIEVKDTSLDKDYEDEQCFYEGKCQVLETAELAYTIPEDDSLSASIKRLLFKSKSETTRILKEINTSKYPAIFYITNERLVIKCKNKDYSFDVSLDDVINVTTDYDHIIIDSTDYSWILLTKDSVYIRDLIVLMNMCYDEQVKL